MLVKFADAGFLYYLYVSKGLFKSILLSLSIEP